MGSKVHSIIATGTKGTLVDIECHLSNNLPNIVIVGFANRAVDESRERIRGAFATSRIMLPRKRITVNLAPADVPKADSGFDLAIAVAIMAAGNQLARAVDDSEAYIGELGLDGSIRAVRGLIGKLLVGRAKGIKTFYIPADNLEQARLVPSLNLVPLASLGQLYACFNNLSETKTVSTGDGEYDAALARPLSTLGLSEVVGQAQAKRALEIAAAGGHNIFFSGPPGTGKSMLAKALPSVLPPLSREEVLEVTHLHSLAGHDYEQIVTHRPFRAPHHSASHVAIVGGGNRLRPGEISLAHRGVLFMDEMPEFARPTLEALRQPLEDRLINVARARDAVQYPANFILVATANPCPCGYFGSKNGKKCSCMKSQIKQYQNRLSGPIMDRIDISCHVSEVEHHRLLSQTADAHSDNEVRQHIEDARRIQAKRFGMAAKLNNDMSSLDLKSLARLERKARLLLNTIAAASDMSARAYMCTVKVARTIADLDGSLTINDLHLSEAINLRYQPSQRSAS